MQCTFPNELVSIVKSLSEDSSKTPQSACEMNNAYLVKWTSWNLWFLQIKIFSSVFDKSKLVIKLCKEQGNTCLMNHFCLVRITFPNEPLLPSQIPNLTRQNLSKTWTSQVFVKRLLKFLKYLHLANLCIEQGKMNSSIQFRFIFKLVQGTSLDKIWNVLVYKSPIPLKWLSNTLHFFPMVWGFNKHAHYIDIYALNSDFSHLR